ncbi:hypothetical protein BH10PSE19_BH10PSE19_01640 [soil metagenome]
MENKTIDKQKTAACHSMAAKHYKEAADLHLEAAKHHEAGDHEKATLAAQKAHGHCCCAKEHVAQASKCCAGIECKK